MCTGCLGLSAGFAVFAVVLVCGASFIAGLLAFISSSTSAASVNCFIFAMKDGSSASGEKLQSIVIILKTTMLYTMCTYNHVIASIWSGSTQILLKFTIQVHNIFLQNFIPKC